MELYKYLKEVAQARPYGFLIVEEEPAGVQVSQGSWESL